MDATSPALPARAAATVDASVDAASDAADAFSTAMDAITDSIADVEPKLRGWLHAFSHRSPRPAAPWPRALSLLTICAKATQQRWRLTHDGQQHG